MITIKLVGGLGNQLFGYYFGQALDKTVKYDLSDQIHGIATQKVSIQETSLKGIFGAFSGELPVRISNQPRIVKRFVSRLLTYQRKIRFRSKVYESKCVGFDVDFNIEEKDYREIHGYFQSYLYVDAAIAKNPELQNLELALPSAWFVSMKTKLLREDPIVIHIRRGDYSKLKDSVGLLNEIYYSNAIRSFLDGSELVQPVWIFSDSPDQIQNSMPKLLDFNPRIIVPPKASTDAEALVLMSHAKKIIIANSTFSWWAARVNGLQKEVIAPSEWFRALPDPEFLIPLTWRRQESSWID